ncbi:hypothetical protein HPB47_015318 [Ixodes persulcatus]|uniref:Uncharacterized protein n=1 Tax=Ixodes persulcatus TaxID=34615 RepID=A0AC60QTU3_IXOPE|nr:hypothetical protein HPB47_015318 [Ixodes persulcatus]
MVSIKDLREAKELSGEEVAEWANASQLESLRWEPPGFYPHCPRPIESAKGSSAGNLVDSRAAGVRRSPDYFQHPRGSNEPRTSARPCGDQGAQESEILPPPTLPARADHDDAVQHDADDGADSDCILIDDPINGDANAGALQVMLGIAQRESGESLRLHDTRVSHLKSFDGSTLEEKANSMMTGLFSLELAATYNYKKRSTGKLVFEGTVTEKAVRRAAMESFRGLASREYTFHLGKRFRYAYATLKRQEDAGYALGHKREELTSLLVWECQRTPDLTPKPTPSYEQWMACLTSPDPGIQQDLVTRARIASRSQGIPD